VALAVIVVIDCDLSVRLINREGCALLGLSEAEIVGSNWFDRFIPAPERESLRSSFLNWLAGTPSGVIAAHNHNDILTADGRDAARGMEQRTALRRCFGYGDRQPQFGHRRDRPARW
jgi:PAS domain S-box-containing protein